MQPPPVSPQTQPQTQQPPVAPSTVITTGGLQPPSGNYGALSGGSPIMTGSITTPHVPPNITQGVGAYRQFAAGGPVRRPMPQQRPRYFNPGWQPIANRHPQMQAPQMQQPQQQPQPTVSRGPITGSVATSPFAAPQYSNPMSQPGAQQQQGGGGYHPLGGQIDADPRYHPASQTMGGHVSGWWARGGAIPDEAA
jgi:hypothetical protein